MKTLGTLFFGFMLSFGCGQKLHPETAIHQPKTGDREYRCVLRTSDLTEDVSRVSTKDDELIWLIYADTAGQKIPDVIFREYFVFDAVNDEKIVTLRPSSEFQSLTFVVLEMDTEKNIGQIEPVVRLNIEKIIEAHQRNDHGTLSELLGTDDIIGIERLDLTTATAEKRTLYFKGFHLFDAFEYRIEITPK